jgi:hypothetical protein
MLPPAVRAPTRCDRRADELSSAIRRVVIRGRTTHAMQAVNCRRACFAPGRLTDTMFSSESHKLYSEPQGATCGI